MSLILTRKPNESVIIGNDPDTSNNAVVTVLGVRGNQIRLGIRAPRHIDVHRREIWERVQAEKAHPDAA